MGPHTRTIHQKRVWMKLMAERVISYLSGVTAGLMCVCGARSTAKAYVKNDVFWVTLKLQICRSSQLSSTAERQKKKERENRRDIILSPCAGHACSCSLTDLPENLLHHIRDQNSVQHQINELMLQIIIHIYCQCHPDYK